MKTQRGFGRGVYEVVVAGVLMAGTAACGGTAATYSGANGNWNVAGNWTPAVVPLDGGGVVYDVTIPSGVTVAYNVAGTNQINTLAMGTATLNLQTNDNVVVLNGGNVMASTVTAAGASFSDGNMTNGDASSFNASAGGVISLGSLATYNASNATAFLNFNATNTGSKVLLPALSTVNFSANDLTISATNGGDVEAPALGTLTYKGSIFESLNLKVGGATSVMNVASLGSAPQMNVNATVNGGTLNWGAPTSLQVSSITLDTFGTINTGTLTNIDSSSLTATNGAVLSVPGVSSYVAGHFLSFLNFNATNSGSKLVLGGLLTVNFNGNDLGVNAVNGGDVELPMLQNLTYTGSIFEKLNISASGSGSVVNVPLLGNSPQQHVNVTVNLGTVNWGNPTTLQQGSITLDTFGTLNTATLTNIDASSLSAKNGAVLSLPAVQSYTANAFLNILSFAASGAGSKVQMGNLTALHFAGNELGLQASGGGDVDLHAITSVTTSGSVFDSLSISSMDDGSVVDLSGLRNTTNFGNSFTLSNNGELLLGGSPGAFEVMFDASFLNATGTLDVLVNGNLIASILPGTLNTTVPYAFFVPASGGTSARVTFLADGAGSDISLSNYVAAVPEPSSLAVVGMCGVLLVRRRVRG